MTIDVDDVFCLHETPRGFVASLRGLTLSVAAGERLLVHGPNGAGKTTLLRLLMAELAASAGTVAVCGIELTNADERQRVRLRRHLLGIVEQSHGQSLRPELTAADNVALQLRLSGVRRGAATKRATELLESLGLGQLAHRPAYQLSGGEAQRVAVCAAVAHEPRLILADEPTGELDRTSADEVYDLLELAAARSGAALLVVSHDQRAARIAHRVVRIRDGRVSEEWSPQSPDEVQLVDARGWVHLPGPLRRDAGIAAHARAGLSPGGITLTAPARSPATESTVDAPTAPTTGGGWSLPPAPILTLTDVSARRGGRWLFTDVRASISPGSLTAILGRSGSGKTTLLRILCGLERPDAGTVNLAGQDLGPLNRDELAALRRRYLAVAAQETILLESMEVMENIELARAARGLPTADPLARSWLLELGLSGLRDRRVRQLSGGERQRVALARVLALSPPVAVVDEPTSRQDEAHAAQVLAALKSAATAGTAVVVATHDPLLLEAATEVIRLG